MNLKRPAMQRHQRYAVVDSGYLARPVRSALASSFIRPRISDIIPSRSASALARSLMSTSRSYGRAGTGSTDPLGFVGSELQELKCWGPERVLARTAE